MSDDKINPIKAPSSLSGDKLPIGRPTIREAAALAIIKQEPSDISLESFVESDFDPLAMGKNFKELHKQTRAETLTSAQIAEEQETDTEIVSRVAQEFGKKNPELNPRALLATKSSIYPQDTQDDILSKVRNAYPDASLADEVLGFLIETAGKNASLKAKLDAAKALFNDTHGREIRAGKNIQQAAREFSQQGLGSPTALRDLYRQITGNPREAPTLFEELSNSFPFPKMKVVIDFILHSLGQDMKAKGPSISRPELQRLFSETRTMQAILGVYRFFYSRMNLVQAEFKRCDLTMPPTINFQNLSKAFMNVLKERYPSAQRILTFASMLGISEEVLAKIIVFNQLRDALRNVSPKLFKSEQHRQDVLMTFIETLSELEDELEDEDEEDEEEE